MKKFTGRFKNDNRFNLSFSKMHENSIRHESSNVIRFTRPFFLILTLTRISMKMILIFENIQMIQNSFNIPVNWSN